jgi:hypothetical protein
MKIKIPLDSERGQREQKSWRELDSLMEDLLSEAPYAWSVWTTWTVGFVMAAIGGLAGLYAYPNRVDAGRLLAPLALAAALTGGYPALSIWYAPRTHRRILRRMARKELLVNLPPQPALARANGLLRRLEPPKVWLVFLVPPVIMYVLFLEENSVMLDVVLLFAFAQAVNTLAALFAPLGEVEDFESYGQRSFEEAAPDSACPICGRMNPGYVVNCARCYAYLAWATEDSAKE